MLYSIEITKQCIIPMYYISLYAPASDFITIEAFAFSALTHFYNSRTLYYTFTLSGNNKAMDKFLIDNRRLFSSNLAAFEAGDNQPCFVNLTVLFKPWIASKLTENHRRGLEVHFKPMVNHCIVY